MSNVRLETWLKNLPYKVWKSRVQTPVSQEEEEEVEEEKENS
jgi:hypothetical protein